MLIFDEAIGDEAIGPTPTHWPIDLRNYHKDRECESNSTLKLFAENRWEYYRERVRGWPGKGGSESTDLGSAFHVKLLEPEKFEDSVAVMPDGMTRLQKAGKEFIAESHEAGKCVIEAGDLQRLEIMMEAVEENPICWDAIQAGGMAEHAVRWVHERTGTGLKVCFDLLRHDASIIDIKTAANPELEGYKGFRSSIKDYSYYRQAALYCLARDLYSPEMAYHFHEQGETGYQWLVVGSEPPHLGKCFLYELMPSLRALGHEHNEQILSALAACRAYADGEDPEPWRSPNHGKVVPIELDDVPYLPKRLAL